MGKMGPRDAGHRSPSHGCGVRALGFEGEDGKERVVRGPGGFSVGPST